MIVLSLAHTPLGVDAAIDGDGLACYLPILAQPQAQPHNAARPHKHSQLCWGLVGRRAPFHL